MNVLQMSPTTAVLLLSVLCGFVLKISVGYGLCCLMARVATSSGVRFLVWLSFLLSSAAYWVFSLVEVYVGAPSEPVEVFPLASIESGIRGVTLSRGNAQIIGRFLGSALLLYFLVVFLLIVLGGWKRLRLARALSYRTEPPEALRITFRRVAADVNAPDCHLWLLPGLTSPAALGWFKPSIYLPEDARSEESIEIRDILLHELSHVQRRDSLWDSLSRLCRCVVCFHPFIYKAFSSLRLEREVACDMAVVRCHPEERDLYADTLVRFGWKTSLAKEPDRVGIGFTSQAAVLNARVRSILEGEQVYSKRAKGTRALLATGACWMFATFAPASWVAFRVMVIPNPVILGIVSHARTTGPKPRNPRSHARPNSEASPEPTALSFVSTPTPSSILPARRNIGFHPQNEEEPMSNPVPDIVTSSIPGSVDPTSPRAIPSPKLPSATAVLVTTASQLGRIRMGHDGDHGHE